MVKHKKFQSYKRHYGRTCITGMLGCRWHRYQQSTDSIGKIGMAWYIVLVCATLFCLFMLYYWIIAENSSDDFSWYVYNSTGAWWPVYTFILGVICTIFTYAVLLFLLTLCHVCIGHQIYIHWIHRILLIVTVVGCLTTLIVASDLWTGGWKLQYLSLMITGPFLHLSCVAAMTFFTWFIAEAWLGLNGKYIRQTQHYLIEEKDDYPVTNVCRGICLGLYMTVMIILYVAPIFIASPCICETNDLPTRPLVFAHRGASAIAPENTFESFNLSTKYDNLYAFEADVSISYDGVPFLMHDNTLARTTNVQAVFPDRVENLACTFNYSELEQLNAGEWFLKEDPYGTVSSLTLKKREEYKNLPIPTLFQLLELVGKHNKKLIIDLIPYDRGIPKTHPYAENYGDIIINTITSHRGLPQENIYWLYKDLLNTTAANNFTYVYGKDVENKDLLKQDNILVNVPFHRATVNAVRAFKAQNITVNVWVVNSAWLYSLYWCMGVPTVTTNYINEFSQIKQPVWHMTPSEFRVMWIATDVLSIVLVIAIFVAQRIRKGIPKKYAPEVVTLQSAKHCIQNKHHNRYMKEKLILAGEGLQEIATEQGVVGISDIENPDSDSLNRYSYSSSAGDLSFSSPFDNAFRMSGVSHLSNVSGVSAISSSARGSVSSSVDCRVSVEQQPMGYGTMLINEGEEGEGSQVQVKDVQVEIT